MKNKLTQLNEVLGLLADIDKSDSNDISIFAGNGYDEASIVATQDSLLVLAEFLIRIVTDTISGKADSSDVFERYDEENIDGYSVDEIKKLFNELADVWPVEVCIAKDSASLAALVKYFNN